MAHTFGASQSRPPAASAPSIARFVQSTAFGPEQVKALTIAFDGACQTLGLVDRDDPMIETVAMAILGVAQCGARGPDQIRQRALAILRSTEPPSSSAA